MRKSQKIWLCVLCVMFILPEIVWSPLLNFIYSLSATTVDGSTQVLRDSFLLRSKFEFFYFLILLIQLLSIVLFTIRWVRVKNFLKSKLIYNVILTLGVLLGLVTFCVVYLAFAINNIGF